MINSDKSQNNLYICMYIISFSYTVYEKDLTEQVDNKKVWVIVNKN